MRGIAASQIIKGEQRPLDVRKSSRIDFVMLNFLHVLIAEQHIEFIKDTVTVFTNDSLLCAYVHIDITIFITVQPAELLGCVRTVVLLSKVAQINSHRVMYE